MINYLCIIQARLGSTRFPNKVMQTVNGISLVKRVWDAAKGCGFIDKTIVAWPERYPDLDENNVLERFRRISIEFPSKYIVRLTADCPLLTIKDISDAILAFKRETSAYYSNHFDGHDVQVFMPHVMNHSEHVIADFSTKSTGLSVNTKADLERVRNYAKS